ncbi:MAG: hypothetical protein ACK5VE_00440 [Alphaproteobacteria bacterium]|jgi:hypothetical protein
MTQWILIVVMSAAGGASLNMWQQPAITTATFTDREACESAGKTVRHMAQKQADLRFVTVSAQCVPSGTEAAK